MWGSAKAPSADLGGVRPPNAFWYDSQPRICKSVKVLPTFTKRPCNIFGRPFVKRFAILSDRCLSVYLSCPVLSVTSVYCGQTVGRIKMKLGMQVGLDHGHIVLDGTQLTPPQRTQPPNFQPMSVAAKRLDELKRHLVWSIGRCPVDFVLDEDPAPPA